MINKLDKAYEMQNGLLQLLIQNGIKPSSIDLCQAIEEAICINRVAERAVILHDYLHQNCGPTDEWPIEIKTSTDEGGKLADLLTELAKAIAKSREARP